jgi:hypothetical protein
MLLNERDAAIEHSGDRLIVFKWQEKFFGVCNEEISQNHLIMSLGKALDSCGRLLCLKLHISPYWPVVERGLILNCYTAPA